MPKRSKVGPSALTPGFRSSTTDSSPSVTRIDLTTGFPDLEIPLGADPFFGPNYAEDIVVIPGDGKTIAVSLYTKASSPRHRGVAVCCVSPWPCLYE